MIIDVSKHQGGINWDTLSPALDFCWIKASGKVKDAMFDINVAAAERCGVPYHVYHFLYCTTEAAARAEAQLFASSVGSHTPLSWALDVERESGIPAAKAPAILAAFEAELRRLRGQNIRIGLYIAHELRGDYRLDYSRYDYIWIPRYGKNTGSMAGAIEPDYPCDVWQYTSNGRAPGIADRVDLDVLMGTKPMEFFTGGTTPVIHTSTQIPPHGGDTVTRVSIGTLVAELEAALARGDGYIMGSYGQNPRTGYLDLSVPESKCKSSWKPTGYYFGGQYSGKQLDSALKWRKNSPRVWDCNGMAEGIYELHTGVCINSKARYNYAQWCSVKGSGMIPAKHRVPGAAVFWSNSGASSIHHVAYLWKPVDPAKPEGDWWIIEAKGVNYGVVKSKLYSRKPNFWGIMDKYFDYGDTAALEPVAVPVRVLGSRILRNGCEGEDVKAMQTGLIRLGYDLGKWGADGDFGDATELAVKAFQTDFELEVDGEFGPLSLAALELALVALDKPVEKPRYVVIEGGDCYIRLAPNTSGKAVGVAHRGEKLAFGGVIDEETRWLLIQYTRKGDTAPTNAWVSGKYGRLTE